MTLTTAQFSTGKGPAAASGPRLPRISYYRNACRLVGGVAGKLEIRQPHAVDQDLIGPDVRGGLEPLGAGAGQVQGIQGVERPARRSVDAGRKQRLGAEADGAVGDRGAGGHAR